MHVIVIGEGYSDGHERFEKTFNGKIYANGKSKLRVRKAVAYTCSLNEEGYEEFLSDIKPFTRYTEDDKPLQNKLLKLFSWIRKIFKSIAPINEDLDKVKASDFYEKCNKEGNHFNMWLYPVGKVKDNYDGTKENV